MIGFLTSSPPAHLPPLELLKCEKTGDVTVRIGNVERTMSIGDWSRLISSPQKVSPVAPAA